MNRVWCQCKDLGKRIALPSLIPLSTSSSAHTGQTDFSVYRHLSYRKVYIRGMPGQGKLWSASCLDASMLDKD